MNLRDFSEKVFAFSDIKAQHYVMRLVKSKLMLVLAVIAVIGQVTAIPVLACEKVTSPLGSVHCHPASQEALDSSFDLDPDATHLHHGSENSTASSESQDNMDEHNCNLCASCSTATNPSSQALRAPQVMPSEMSVYLAPIISNTLESLFRPPISA